MPPDSKISFLLNGSLDDRTCTELAAPTIQQGSSPNLVQSTNSRLSVKPGTCVRSPSFSSVGSAKATGTSCFGLIPATVGDAAVAFFTPHAGGSTRIADAGRSTYGTGLVRSPLNATKAANCYLPTRIESAGALPSVTSLDVPRSAYNETTGCLWHAWAAPASSGIDIYVSVTDADGTLLAAPVVVDSLASPTYTWIGLTTHGADGQRLWYIDAGASALYALSLSLVGNQVTVVSDLPVRLLGTLDCAFDAVSRGDRYAYFVGPSTSGATAGAVVRIDVTNLSQTVASIAGAITGGSPQCAAHIETIGGTTYLACAFSSLTSSQTIVALYNAATMAQLWTATITGYGSVATKFLVSSGASYVVVAISDTIGGFNAGGGTMVTHCHAYPLAGGSVVDLPKLPWTSLQNRGVQWKISSGEMYPVFFASRIYATAATSPTTPDYVDDPSIEAYLVGSTSHVSPIARFGVVRGTLAPAKAPPSRLPSQSVVAIGSRIHTNYLKDNFEAVYSSAVGYVARYVTLDLAPAQPRIAHDKDGAAIVAAALPVQWDGVEVVELGAPLHRPHLRAATTGGGFVPGTSGTHSFMAVYQWTDAAGLLHRSRPSNIGTITWGLTDTPLVEVTIPDGLRNGVNQKDIEIVVYATAPSGTAYYAQPSSTLLNISSTESVASYSVRASMSTSTAQIYSVTGAGGEELFPQPPPPLHDVTVVGSRMWGIDAEVRSRLVYSKLRVAGIGFEFFPAGEINFPSGAGELMAVREWQGVPVVLTENAVYQIAGDGPSNTGGPSSLGQPVKISEIGCSNHLSVAVFPGGILWQREDDFVLFNGSAVQVVPTILADHEVSSIAVLRNQDEVLFFTDAAPEIKVFNYALGRWTKWDNDTHAHAIQCAANIPNDADTVLTYSADVGAIYRLDAATSSAAGMTFETDWVLLAGDFEDHVLLRSIIFNGYIDAGHDLTIDVFTNHDASTPTTSYTWTSAALSDVATGERYTVKLDPAEPNTRAVKVRIADTGGMLPRNVTIVYTVRALTYPDAFLQGAHGG